MANLKSTKKGQAKLESVNFSKGQNKDKQDIRINVKEIKNGFIISKTTEGRDAKGNWQYNNEEWYSETNPLAIKTDDKSLADLFD